MALHGARGIEFLVMSRTAGSLKEGWCPHTPEELGAVRAQLKRLLDDPLFNQSRRYPSLLRRIVEDSLAGHTDNLKERILGMELFDRAADYDTNADAIVRVTAAEIRKRIALYYHDEKHSSELRIDLPLGGYIAEFRPSTSLAVAPAFPVQQEPDAPSLNLEPSVLVTNRSDFGHWARRIAVVVTVFAILILAGMWFRPRSDFRVFWKPLTDSPTPTLICVGQLPLEYVEVQGPKDSLARALLSQKPVSISDTVVVSTFATFLGTQGMSPHIRVSTQTSYSDLRNSPILLVGGLDNSWTMRLLDGLRYRMKAHAGSSIVQIYNAERPEQEHWELDFSQATDHITEDYAIVARFADHATENTVIIAAGLGEDGTSAAADFLTHPQYLKALGDGAPKNWNVKNVQAVIKTQVIDGKPGPPVVITKYFW